MEMLKDKPLCAGDISKEFSTSGATISYHLHYLKKSGLVSSNRKGQKTYYEVNKSELAKIIAWLKGFTVT